MARSTDKRRGAKKPRAKLDDEDGEFTEAMAELDASGAWKALAEKVLSEKELAEKEAEPTPAAVSRSERRRRAEAEIERLDLHGHTFEEALDRLEPFLVSATARDRRRVLVITGRGRRSAGGVPVLRRKVAVWLRSEAKPWVRELEIAPRRLGGEGALLVHLRRPRPR